VSRPSGSGCQRERYGPAAASSFSPARDALELEDARDADGVVVGALPDPGLGQVRACRGREPEPTMVTL
jgi:hypothetical protein